MLLVMPVCNIDLAMARDVSAWMRELGPEPNHRALLVWAPEVGQADRDYILDNFQNTFSKVNQMQPQFLPNVAGWPDAPNLTFEFAVHYCCADNPLYARGEPWFFFEADQTPMCEGWLDALQEEYRKLGKPCLGMLEQSWKVRNGEKLPAGKHLVGTAIYPANFHVLTSKFRGCRTIAFDVAMQDDIVVPGHAAHTNLMMHCWLTDNFRRNADGDIVCDKREGRLAGQIGFSLDRTIPKDSGVVLVHGCKDGSLLRLLREERAERACAPAPVTGGAEIVETMELADSTDSPVETKPKRRIKHRPVRKNVRPGDPDEVQIRVVIRPEPVTH